MLYCPNCGAEYREGFSSCSDCHVLLVHEPQHDFRQESVPEPGDPNKDPFCAFWQGDDPRIHAELCGVLEEAGIQHKTVYRKDHLFNLANYPTFQVGVPASRFEDAENVIHEAFPSDSREDESANSLILPRLLPDDRKNQIRKLPEMLSTGENIPGPEAPGDPEDWFSEDATALVWSGDAYVASAILAALNENDLHVRRELRNNMAEVFVLPDEQIHAKEIIREIVESTPME